MSTSLEGGCARGQIRYECTAEPNPGTRSARADLVYPAAWAAGR